MVKDIRWLWFIVSLLGLSMIGTIYVQVKLVRESIAWSKQNFDRQVYEALAGTVQAIEKRADELDLEDILTAPFFGSKDMNQYGSPLFQLTDSLNSDQLRSYRPRLNNTSGIFNKIRNQNLDITDLISIEMLDYHLRQNLEKRGIVVDYHYGVLSNKYSSLIIQDGNYTVPEGIDAQSGLENTDRIDLYSTPYAAPMFAKDTSSLGELRLSFPNPGEEIYEDIINDIIAAIFFSMLILFCFGYTLYIILAQKNLSLMKTDFINNMTHEFKTPIATISLASDSILSHKVINDEEKVKKFINIIKQENTRMLTQVESVLQMAKLDNQEIKLQMEVLNLNEILGNAVSHIQLQVSKRQGHISEHFPPKVVQVYGDRNHISNVFHNLLDNANKYSNQKPEIHVYLKVEGNHARVDIRDNGIGMNREQIRHIFEKFYRVHTGNIHDVKGFGLGLAYVKATIDAHDGQVLVDSVLGKGSTFTVLLPLNEL